MPEEMIVENCSPVLAGLKTANLFSVPFEGRKGLVEDLRQMNAVFVKKGLRAIPLGRTKTRALIYIYRPDRLAGDLKKEGVEEALEELGYRTESPNGCVAQLRKRMQDASPVMFPHEIGFFLGYPPEDVLGYIRHSGKDCKCTGFWKVYGDEQKAQKTFSRYRSCTESYFEQWEKGKSIDELTVQLSCPRKAVC